MSGDRRAWGWHELDARRAEQIVADSAVRAGDLVLDIGAGLGAVTAPLVATGARVIAIEAHAGRAEALRDRLGTAARVVRADAADLRLPRRPFHVVASPPFAITTLVLRRLLAPGSRLVSAHLVLQRQAARRWAGPGAPGAGRWQAHFDASVGRRVPRSDFRPPPRVDCQVLSIRRRW